MLKIIYILCFTVLVTGCSIGNTTSADEETKRVTPDQIVTEDTNQTQPQYIDERDYEGDELGIVKTMNQYIKAVYEKDNSLYNSVVTEPMTRATEKNDFKKYFISIHKLDFSIKPYPTPPKDVKPVVIEYTGKILGDENTIEDKQLFLFRFEDGIWKLIGISDHLNW